ncbi:hypothetical protein [Pseudomonas nitroreducens]|uniref:hypothetical protein n=1 Tax=Pseudomonas nitroreducens TaxID=46680 RepID=UPI002D806E70|nr:hypothetical protein [Pseudomonas nitroreducens]
MLRSWSYSGPINEAFLSGASGGNRSMRQPSIHLLQGQLLALQAQLNALFASLPPVILEEVQEHLQRQADLARVDIISIEWAGPVMPGFEDQLGMVERLEISR